MSEETTYSEDTLFKVRAVLEKVLCCTKCVNDAINELQNNGILFRERVVQPTIEVVDRERPVGPFNPVTVKLVYSDKGNSTVIRIKQNDNVGDVALTYAESMVYEVFGTVMGVNDTLTCYVTPIVGECFLIHMNKEQKELLVEDLRVALRYVLEKG